MILNTCIVNVNESQRELKMHGTPDFPCGAYRIDMSPGGMPELPWHWHEELEFVYITAGEVEMRVPGLSVSVQPGDCFCVNSNVLHGGRALENSELRSLVFNAELVSGGMNTVFARRYIRPLTANRGFTGVLLRASEYPEAAGAFQRAARAIAGEEPGYEFTVREALSRLCLILSERFAAAGVDAEGQDADNERVKLMLSYINENFASPISLAGIARSAQVSARECERAFKRLLSMTPKQYVIRYRADQAANLLQSRPDKSVADIALECGFNSSSAFARSFRDYYGLSPREYRAAAKKK